MKKFARVLLVALLALTAILAGCGGGEDKGTKKTELNVRMVKDIQTLDPHSNSGADYNEYNILQQIYDSLVEFEGSNQFAVRACLAETWEINDMQTEYVFHLREDVKFHDGTPLTAEDVVFTVQRFLVLPATASKSYFVDKAEAVDEHTVKITLKYPYPNFILQLASWPWRIVSKAAVEQYGDGHNGIALVGTGPYKLESLDAIQPGKGITLVKNEDYYNKDRAYFEKINYHLVTDDQTALIMFENGELDSLAIASGIDAKRLKELGQFNVVGIRRPGCYIMALNCTKAPLDDVRVRRAINHAINREALVELVWDGENYADQELVVSPGEENYPEDGFTSYDYNVNKAKQLLAEAGYGDQELVIEFIYPTSGIGPDLAAALQQQLGAAGIYLKTIAMDPSAWYTAQTTQNYMSTFVENQSIPYNPGLTNFLFYTSTASLNYSKYFDERIDQLAMGAFEVDATKRKGYFAQIQKIVKDQAIYAPLAGVKTNVAFNPHLKGMEFEPNTMITKFCDWYWEE